MRIFRLVSFYRALILLAALLPSACKRPLPVTTIIVLDVSASITPRAAQAALDAVGERITRLGRGERLILIPITGDARNDAQGHILRLSVPIVREPYDTDLARFRAEARKQLAAWVASLGSVQGSSDILGALDAARQEFAALPEKGERTLIVASDFLEYDHQHDFTRNHELASPALARTLAHRLRAERGISFQGVVLCLGRLESRDFAQLTENRKAAVTAFWTEYLSSNGSPASLQFDGTGLLAGQRSCVINTSAPAH